MIPSAFEYARATSLDDALARMQAANGAGKLIAGGHSLVPLMKLRLSEPQLLIDISRIPELAGIRERDGKIVIGACTVHHDVASSALLHERCPIVCRRGGDHRRPAGAQSRHDWRQRRPCRPLGRHAGGAGGARCGDSPQGAAGLADGEGR